jgi:hypothetical protein
MALTRDQIDDLAEEGVFLGNVYEIAQAIEAEVRKEDTELIRQLVEAMEGVKALNMGGELALWTAEFYRLLSAIAAARARMSPPPTA